MPDLAPDMVYNGIAYSVKRLAQKTSFRREVFGRSHCLRLFGFFLWRMDLVRKVIFIRHPKTAMEIIKSTNTRSVAGRKAGKDGMEMVFLQVSSPFGIGSKFEFYGKQNGAKQVRGSLGAGPKTE